MAKRPTSGFPLQDYYTRIYKAYDQVNRLFTFGQDKKWRRLTIEACLAGNPKRVLDLCCGTGDLAISICRTGNEQIRITGYDLNQNMLEIARQKAIRFNTQSVEFIQGDAASMPFSNNEFDCILIGFGLRNLIYENPDMEKHLQEINRVMKPGARLLILESTLPENRFIGLFYRLYLKLVLVPLGGLLSGHWKAYRYLADSSAGFYDFSELNRLFEVHQMVLHLQQRYFFGSVNLLIATKKGT
jgi:demethylmenaquinone methyltransferase/2-methoxy-6-polyprenyl-1,4-benzoquinol methylase